MHFSFNSCNAAPNESLEQYFFHFVPCTIVGLFSMLLVRVQLESCSAVLCGFQIHYFPEAERLMITHGTASPRLQHEVLQRPARWPCHVDRWPIYFKGGTPDTKRAHETIQGRCVGPRARRPAREVYGSQIRELLASVVM